jgi:hypothetical protein
MIVKLIFPLADRELLIVHLTSFDWDFTLGTTVKVIQRGGAEVLARQIGTGDHEGSGTRSDHNHAAIFFST